MLLSSGKAEGLSEDIGRRSYCGEFSAGALPATKHNKAPIVLSSGNEFYCAENDHNINEV